MILRKCFLIFVCLVNSCVLFRADEPEAYWEPDIYQGNPDTMSLERQGEDRRSIGANHETFGQYLCMHIDDMEYMFKTCMEARK